MYQKITDQGVDTGAVWHLGGHTDLHEPHYYVYDHLDNTRIVYTPLLNLDTSGYDSITLSLVNVLDYFPYGKISREYRAEGSERYLTTGHERDEETGLDNRGARWYDSDVARFLSLDPKAEQYANWSSYNYVLANPIRLTDPDGKDPGDGEDGSNELEQIEEASGAVNGSGHYHYEEPVPETGSEGTAKSKNVTDVDVKGDVHEITRTHYDENGKATSTNETTYYDRQLGHDPHERVVYEPGSYDGSTVTRYHVDGEGNYSIYEPTVKNNPRVAQETYEQISENSGTTAFDVKNANSFRGASPDDVDNWLSNNGWNNAGATKSGNGVKYTNGNYGEQVRIMPGYSGGNRPDLLKTGPYMEISISGQKSYVPLNGNPTLK